MKGRGLLWLAVAICVALLMVLMGQCKAKADGPVDVVEEALTEREILNGDNLEADIDFMTAGLGPRISLRWEVQFGMDHGGYIDTRWFLKSITPLYSWTFFRSGMGAGVMYPASPEGWERWAAGPPFMFEATGFQLAPDQGQDSFVGINWSSGQCLPGPKFVFIRRINQDVVYVYNTTGKNLFVDLNGKNRPRLLAPGNFYKWASSTGGGIKLFTERKNPWSQCASIWWRR